MEVMNGPQKRHTYSHAERVRFAELIRQFGARGAREVLSRQVCVGTLLKIAAEFGIGLKRGRRPAPTTSQNTRSEKKAA